MRGRERDNVSLLSTTLMKPRQQGYQTPKPTSERQQKSSGKSPLLYHPPSNEYNPILSLLFYSSTTYHTYSSYHSNKYIETIFINTADSTTMHHPLTLTHCFLHCTYPQMILHIYPQSRTMTSYLHSSTYTRIIPFSPLFTVTKYVTIF